MCYAGLDIHKAFTVGIIKTKEREIVNKGKFANTEEILKISLKIFHQTRQI